MIVITEFMDESAIAQLSEDFETIYEPTIADRQNEIVKLLPNARALIIRNRTQVNQILLDSAPKLTCIGRLGVGLDNIDTQACTAKNIQVFPATGANDLSVAEYVITNAMMLLRQSYNAKNEILSGKWPRQQCTGHELSGKIIGLIGYGLIAQRIARYARTFEMTICAYDPYLPENDIAWQQAKKCTLDDLLSKCDVVSLHVPLTNETKHIIDTNSLAKMKPDAVLINTARGGVVDETALVTSLRNKLIAGAAIDVFEKEPLSAEDGKKFANIPNLYLTPHIAGVTYQSNIRVSHMIATAVRKHLTNDQVKGT